MITLFNTEPPNIIIDTTILGAIPNIRTTLCQDLPWVEWDKKTRIVQGRESEDLNIYFVGTHKQNTELSVGALYQNMQWVLYNRDYDIRTQMALDPGEAWESFVCLLRDAMNMQLDTANSILNTVGRSTLNIFEE